MDTPHDDSNIPHMGCGIYAVAWSLAMPCIVYACISIDKPLDRCIFLYHARTDIQCHFQLACGCDMGTADRTEVIAIVVDRLLVGSPPHKVTTRSRSRYFHHRLCQKLRKVVHLFYNTLHAFKSVRGSHHNPWVIEVCIRSVITYLERGIGRGMFWECGVQWVYQALDLKLAGCSERRKGGIVLLCFSPPHCGGGGPFGGGGRPR